VTAAATEVPETLIHQLAVGGHLVIPIGPERGDQELYRITRTEAGFEPHRLCAVRFVPLISGALPEEEATIGRRRHPPTRDRRVSGVAMTGMGLSNPARLLVAAILVLLAGCNFSGRPAEESAPGVSAGGGIGAGRERAGAGRLQRLSRRYRLWRRPALRRARAYADRNQWTETALSSGGRAAPASAGASGACGAAGDTLLAISRIYGVDQSSLARVNNLMPPYALKSGQRLTLPGRIDANLAEMRRNSSSRMSRRQPPVQEAAVRCR